MMHVKARKDGPVVLYTLAKFFVWALGFALLGAIVGWLLRAIRCSREVAAATASTVDQAEVERLRHRVANLEPIVHDRDSLRQRVAELEAELKPLRSAPAPPAAVQGFAGLPAQPAAAAAPAAAFGVTPDLDAGRAVLGKAWALDDLEIVEGIGPVLAGVLRAGGITTWAELGRASAEEIRAVLVAADERHRMHDPSSWPRQARLAAIGEWEALKSLQDELTAGR